MTFFAPTSSHLPIYKPFLVVCMLSRFSCVASQAPLSMAFSRHGLSCPSLEVLPDPRIKPTSLASSALAGRFFTTITTQEAQTLFRFPIFLPCFIPSCSEWMSKLSTGLWLPLFFESTAFSHSVHFPKYWSPTSSAHPWCSAFWARWRYVLCKF